MSVVSYVNDQLIGLCLLNKFEHEVGVNKIQCHVLHFEAIGDVKLMDIEVILIYEKPRIN